jgi:transcriptional regulator with XRE-family HTH domain
MTLAGEFLKRARREAGLSQTAVAAGARVRQPLVSRIETGGEQPSLPLLSRLVQACGYRVQLDLVPGLDEHHRGLLAASLRLTVTERIDRLVVLNRVAGDLQEAVNRAQATGR